MCQLDGPETADGCGVSAPCFSVARCFELCGDPKHSPIPQHRLIPIPNMLTRGACDTKHLPVVNGNAEPINDHAPLYDQDFKSPYGHVRLHQLHQLCFTHRHDNGEMMEVLRRWLVSVLTEDNKRPVPADHTPGTHRLPQH